MEENSGSRVVIFFDTETNGISYKSSVLSISALKGLVDPETGWVELTDKFERYYFPVEPFNWGAIRVNHLDGPTIQRLRGKNCPYPKYFQDDQEAFEAFSADCNRYVAHNIDFDRAFLRKTLKKTFCTMKGNLMAVKAPSSKPGTPKWPNLAETAAFYHIRLPEDEGTFHQSGYDALMVMKIFEQMLKTPYGKQATAVFLK
ncbi:MAG: 3'-5' exonuclease [Fusobacteriaceae bacterium]|jgi:DNA polymerase-3 subunit epsilon|nr:3'-5' exonuclease [Fusobacteriaceae bacterium]